MKVPKLHPFFAYGFLLTGLPCLASVGEEVPKVEGGYPRGSCSEEERRGDVGRIVADCDCKGYSELDAK